MVDLASASLADWSRATNFRNFAEGHVQPLMHVAFCPSTRSHSAAFVREPLRRSARYAFRRRTTASADSLAATSR